MIQLAPAKINLGLRITGRRNDGFHDLHSIVIPVPFYDLIEIIPDIEGTSDAEFSMSGIIPDGLPENNLCIRAYRLFSAYCGVRPVRIHLHKQIPFGAGLGGGSSNAVTVLKALNVLFDTGIPDETMKEMALKLGSDCSIFLHNKPMLMEGRGDILTDVSLDLYHYEMVILNPGLVISTAKAYALIEPEPFTEPLPELIRKPEYTWRETIRNDFEKPVFGKFPAIRKMRDGLYEHGAVYAALSGSGSSLYGLFRRLPELPDWIGKNLIWKGTLKPVTQIP
ncbi:MAG: 4-(cytidine 5'-diphospho)-2-C-methyl-D-erythritol kinase [Bacteroidales bacterium]|nr:4-(cytidine 5'-diphospho)-2-C-methyl-D-erythritol kinase [Bacteroidales bacterium]MBN2698197.1 4-(cytidine 5'-diphospho)-2-C-methyl-D-erythritol kinase [Bacteroidales bacterium]